MLDKPSLKKFYGKMLKDYTIDSDDDEEEEEEEEEDNDSHF